MYGRDESDKKYLNAGNSKSEEGVISGSFLISWIQPDGVVRAKLKKSQVPEPLVFFGGGALSVTCAEVGARFIWFGFESGTVCAIKFAYDCKTFDLTLTSFPLYLYGHLGRVNAIQTSSEFGIAVTASEDKTVILWDMVKHQTYPTYIQTVEMPSTPYLADISKTSGTIVTVSADLNHACLQDLSQGDSSLITLMTVNGVKIAERTVEPAVTALTQSAAPEGTSVNVVVTGHGKMTGVIRIWSSWDLTPIRDICTKDPAPITALTFSIDNQMLYAATEDDHVIIFEKANFTGLKRPPKYLKFIT